MTDDETARFEVLKLATEEGKFAIALGGMFASQAQQSAFEWLLMQGWVRLIDLTPLAAGEPGRLFRVFLASQEAMHWFRSQH